MRWCCTDHPLESWQKVMVKQVTPDKVKILFTDGKTWKGLSHAQVLAKVAQSNVMWC
ncbi:unnamed protein product [Symbiodinium necroappetens]|uniref:Uncharacterized protein n=1 Tax=Symbiodinium necroappetens TaxID=1628268 RepID=A0A812PHK3_9DINO|nr:unnamed protein product [Symbiodinium necroappetens]